MIKVLHILSDSNIGGAGTYIANLIKNYDREKFELSVLLPRGSAVTRLLDGLQVKITQADITPDKSLDIKAIPILRRHIKESGCDIMHAHGSASARLACKGVCPSVFTKHTLSVGGAGLRGAFDRMMYRMTGGYAIAVSAAARDNLISLGFNKKKIYTVLNGVSDMEIPSLEQRSAAKKSFGIDSGKFVVGCVARFSPEKDHETLLYAAKTACERYDKLAFLFCGDGATLNDMKTLAKRLNIYSKCVFAGTVYDAVRAYHAMDMYCITSKHESFGQSLVEAWSAGLPSVTTDAKGFSEISKNGISSLICNTGDAAAVAGAICEIYEDREKAALLAKNGRALYEEKYGGKTFAQGIERVYESVYRK